jgi:hypothetical protein
MTTTLGRAASPTSRFAQSSTSSTEKAKCVALKQGFTEPSFRVGYRPKQFAVGFRRTTITPIEISTVL